LFSAVGARLVSDKSDESESEFRRGGTGEEGRGAELRGEEG